MKIDIEIVVEPLPEDKLLAFHQVVGIATLDDHTFEITRSLSGLHLAFHEEVDSITVVHTLDLNPVIEAALTAITTGETTE